MALILKKNNALIRLMRIDRPIGTILVLMPTLWSLFIAGEGHPPILMVVIFTLGSFLMRSAGCIINDIADRKIDLSVSRTKNRPIATGEVSVKKGLILSFLLAGLSFLIILPLNGLTMELSVMGLLLAIIYPFTKRFISLPQLVLGVSFGWGAIMAWAAVRNSIELPGILIFIANIFWSLAYDTIYALMDRDDDIRAGVKSSAILFGDQAWLAIGASLVLVSLFLVWVGMLAHLQLFYYLTLVLAGFLFARQVVQLRANPSPEAAFRHFKNHGLFGSLILAGIVGDYLIR